MREQALTTPDASADLHRGSADALPTVKGSSETPARISESFPADGGFLSRLLYQSSYMLSYGVVFPVMMVVHVVPKNNAIVHGLVDGALAARDQVSGWGADDHLDDTASEVEEAEDGSSLDGKASAETNHRRRASRRGRGAHATPKRSNRKS